MGEPVVTWGLWDRVLTDTDRPGRVVCLQGARVLVWYGYRQGEAWHAAAALRPPAAVQLELFA